MNKKRDYRKEYIQYYGESLELATPTQKLHREQKAARNRARRLLMKQNRVQKFDDRDVDHKDRNPLNNRLSNLRVQHQSINRARNSHVF